VFSNRAFGWKLAGALALVLALGAASAAGGRFINPAPWRCLAQPARWDGTRLWIPSARILSAGPDSFVLETEGLPFEVRGRAAVAPGDVVGVSGTFDAAGPHLRLREWRKGSGLRGWRRIAEAVSFVVLALILLNFLRHFACRPALARAEGVD